MSSVYGSSVRLMDPRLMQFALKLPCLHCVFLYRSREVASYRHGQTGYAWLSTTYTVFSIYVQDILVTDNR